MGITKVYSINLLNEEIEIVNNTLEQMVTVGVKTPDGDDVNMFPIDMVNEIFDEVCQHHNHVAIFSVKIKDNQPIGQPQIERCKGTYFNKPMPFVNFNGPNFFNDMKKLNNPSGIVSSPTHKLKH